MSPAPASDQGYAIRREAALTRAVAAALDTRELARSDIERPVAAAPAAGRTARR
jgi:hypothetical protein